MSSEFLTESFIDQYQSRLGQRVLNAYGLDHDQAVEPKEASQDFPDEYLPLSRGELTDSLEQGGVEVPKERILPAELGPDNFLP
jgi:hypothetical protein